MDREQLIHDFLIAHHSKYDTGNINRFLKSSYVQFAIDFLQPGEIPEKVMYAGGGYLWATNIRVFYAGALPQGFFKSDEPFYQEFLYENITAVRFKEGRFGSASKVIFHISTTAAKGDIEDVDYGTIDRPKEITQEFAYYVRDKVAALRELPNNTRATKKITGDIVDRLERLSKLSQQGAITEQEFLTAKKKLLDNETP